MSNRVYKHQDEILNHVRKGDKKIFVEFTRGPRKGSIGEIVKVKTRMVNVNIYTGPKSAHRYKRKANDYKIVQEERIDSFVIAWEGRPKKLNFEDSWSMDYLEDYTGPTKWVYVTKKGPGKLPCVDMLGRTIEIDDLVSFVTSLSEGKMLCLGRVIRRTPGGNVVLRCIRVRGDEPDGEVRSSNKKNLLLIKADMENDIMFRRLQLA